MTIEVKYWTDGIELYEKTRCDFQHGWVDATQEQITQYEADKLYKQIEQETTAARDEAMLKGFIYGLNADGSDRYISVTKDDGDGMIQVERSFARLRSAIDRGILPINTVIETVIKFKNKIELPMTETEFDDFALLFAIERGKFFI